MTYGRYFEPFAGGASLYLHLEPEHAVLADTNPDLIDTYRALSIESAAVIGTLRLHAEVHGRAHYYSTREIWNARESKNTAWKAATFLYLNKTCFNGLWRVNADGNFNTPLGDTPAGRIVDEHALRAAGAAFARASLLTTGFRDTVGSGQHAAQHGARSGDFVYFDPPYIPTSTTANFTGYTTGGFGEAEHRALADTARDLASRGVQVMISNSDTPLAWQLYGMLPGFRIERVARSGTMNSDPTKRGKVSELIITSYPPENYLQNNASG
jgi:DNA adenine methylase